MNNLGLYLHIPFCKKKCGYCDFYSLSALSFATQYVDRLCEDLRCQSERCADYAVDTIYFGGGTPSLLSTDDLARLITAIRENYRVSANAEITVEVNPSSVDAQKALYYRSCGVNRISIGMQSSFDSDLRLLGRLHDRADFERAYTTIRDAGFDNINVDLMYALPDETPDHTEQNVRYLLALAPEHISAYCLKIEPGTPFAERKLMPVQDDTAFDCYTTVCELLEKSGYSHYEISNFAKDRRYSRHNMKYWTGAPYLGFGPSAYSYFSGVRYGYARDIRAYLDGRAVMVDREEIGDREAAREHVMLGLRLAHGVRADLLDTRKVKALCDAGYMSCQNGYVHLTTAGYFVSNAIISEFID